MSQLLNSDGKKGFWLPFVFCAGLFLITMAVVSCLLPPNASLRADSPMDALGLKRIVVIFPAAVRAVALRGVEQSGWVGS